MSKNQNQYNWLKILTGSYVLTMLIACASVQSPTGGPKDVQPPKVISEEPKNLTRNFKSKTIELGFDELVKLTNTATEISISPALDVLPTFKIRKNFLDITFEDTLEKNTTYTINFGKAVGDVNENNILKNYTYVFSTGDKIDSLSISGKVTSALTQESLQDVTVFLLPVRQDTLFGKKRASIFTSTDSSGNYSIKNLREDTYRVYALKEQTGGNRIYNGTNEEIGFVTEPVKLTKDTANVNIQVFKEVPERLAFTERKIEGDGRITLILNKPAQDPGVKITDPVALDARKVTEFTANRDSALMWIPEMTFDSLQVALTDTGRNMDTVMLRRNKRDTYTRNIFITENTTGGRLKPGTDLMLTTSTPVTSFDAQQFSLLQDSVAVNGIQVTRVNGSTRKFSVKYPWRSERNYELNISEGAFTDLYGTKSKASVKTFTLDDPENYGNLTVQVKAPDTTTSILVQLLNNQDEILRTDSVPPSGRIQYISFPVGKYMLRFVYDINKNGKWDTGSVREKRQPEKVFNYQKTLALRPNWDIEEPVTIPPAQ
ncbi:MAG TPA: Ig-like domain-containing protein [Sphingobacteriaceae bacterium]